MFSFPVHIKLISVLQLKVTDIQPEARKHLKGITADSVCDCAAVLICVWTGCSFVVSVHCHKESHRAVGDRDILTASLGTLSGWHRICCQDGVGSCYLEECQLQISAVAQLSKAPLMHITGRIRHHLKADHLEQFLGSRHGCSRCPLL